MCTFHFYMLFKTIPGNMKAEIYLNLLYHRSVSTRQTLCDILQMKLLSNVTLHCWSVLYHILSV